MAAKAACAAMGLRTSCEYLRLDCMGYARIAENGEHNWRLRIAFEHEQKPGCWPDEFCKLAHVMADLRVLAFYHRFEPTSNAMSALCARLQERIKALKDILTRAPESKWLFIVGAYSTQKPPYRPSDQPFVAFTLDDECKVTPLEITVRLRPCDLKVEQPSAEVVASDWSP